MKTLCFLITLLLYITKFICSDHLNVGTVLFTKSHLQKKCWSDTEIMLLSARQIMQGVLPEPDLIDFSKPRTITVLLDYFQSCFEVISVSTCRKTQRLMFLALADALGGYLRSYILPLTRQAYYSGHIKYFQARKAYIFYEELREYLKTNGAGWAEPRKCTLKSKIKPLKIPTKNCKEACSQLYLRDDLRQNRKQSSNCDDKPESGPCGNPECGFHDRKRFIDMIEKVRNCENLKSNGDTLNRIAQAANLNEGNDEQIEKIHKKMKRSRRRLRSYMTNATMHDLGVNFYNSSIETLLRGKALRRRSEVCPHSRNKKRECGKQPLLVPLPILDDPAAPKAIALPFRVRPLRSLCSSHAVSVLVRYYITVVSCLLSTTKNKSEFYNFNSQFQCWLSSNVFPHLDKEEWYPAFGAVRRIDATINSFGTNSYSKCKSLSSSDIRYLFSNDAFEEYEYTKKEESPYMDIPPCSKREDGKYAIIGISMMIIIWLLAFCYCICCHCSSRKGEAEEAPQDTSREKKQKMDSSNSFIVQCLVKFFKRAEEERKENEFANQNMVYEAYCGNGVRRKEAEPDRGESCARSVKNESRNKRSVSKERLRRETIVLPAMEYNTFWPMANFQGDKNMRKDYPNERMKCLFSKKESLQSKDKKSFRTLWKREKSPARTSDNCEAMRNQNRINTENCILKRKADVLSRSSYSDSEDSRSSNRRFSLSRSHSDYKYPESCCYSCNSSSGRGSATQAEYTGRPKNCHEYFAKRARLECKENRTFEKRKSETETESNSASCSSSEESFRQVKRMP